MPSKLMIPMMILLAFACHQTTPEADTKDSTEEKSRIGTLDQKTAEEDEIKDEVVESGKQPDPEDMKPSSKDEKTPVASNPVTSFSTVNDVIARLTSSKWSACSKFALENAGYLRTTFTFTANGQRSTFQKAFKDASCTTAFTAQDIMDLNLPDSPLFTTGQTSEATYTISKVVSANEFNIDLVFDSIQAFIAVKLANDGALHFGGCTSDEVFNGCSSSDALRAKNFEPGVGLIFSPHKD